MKNVPNLTYKKALDYTIYLQNHEAKDDDQFNFIQVETCEPFPMLVTSTAIRQYRKRISQHISDETLFINCKNTYANTMRFFRATGIDKGKSFDEDYGNNNYLPITRLDINRLREEGIANYDQIQVIIEKKADDMALVLSRGSQNLKRLLKYTFTEIMRNVPEHSNADSIWYCAQYWPTKDFVELAFIDEGIGIKNSLLTNYAYTQIIDSDKKALEYAIKPGVSSSFAPGSQNMDKSEWANSGFGLYMISNLCAELGGDFTLASGETALKVSKNTYDGQIQHTFMRCFINGTAIRITIKPSSINSYENVARQILKNGEALAKADGKSIHFASMSTKKILE